MDSNNKKRYLTFTFTLLLVIPAFACDGSGGENRRARQDLQQVNGNAQAETITGNIPRVDPETGGSSISWQQPRFDERRKEREAMVNSQMRDIRNEKVLAAMTSVPRHLFVPPDMRRHAYKDHPLPIGHGQTISQPYIVAMMTEVLGLEPGKKVLEIGTGSGYQAAVLSELTPEVYTIEVIETLAEQARKRFEELGYTTIRSRTGDGYFGWEEQAPFDAIIVTCAAGHVPPPLIKQLALGGRMVIPVGGVYAIQRLILVTSDNEGRVEHRDLIPVRFVPMIGHENR